jgi:hypothetical protein
MEKRVILFNCIQILRSQSYNKFFQGNGSEDDHAKNFRAHHSFSNGPYDQAGGIYERENFVLLPGSNDYPFSGQPFFLPSQTGHSPSAACKDPVSGSISNPD